MTLPLDFCKPPAPHPRKWCGKEGKGDVKCCTKADFWGLNSGKIFLQKIISMCFPFFLSSCNGLKRISFLGHFCMESEQGSTAEPTKEGKSTHTHTRQRRETPGESCQLAGSQKSRRENQTGDVSGEKLGHCSPSGIQFQKTMSYHRRMSQSSAFHSSSMGLCVPLEA